MTYCSRKSWISLGLGSSSNLRSDDSESSSSMISLHRSMHSSQMYTPGPAMSLLTCFCDFPQNEHLSSSPPSPNFATVAPLNLVALARADRAGVVCEVACRDDLVDDAVHLGFFGLEDEVAVGVLRDPLHGLTRVVGEDAVQEIAHAKDL